MTTSNRERNVFGNDFSVSVEIIIFNFICLCLNISLFRFNSTDFIFSCSEKSSIIRQLVSPSAFTRKASSIILWNE